MQDWRCFDDKSLPCPPEGCPVMYGCARARGWTDGLEPPVGYFNLVPLENLISDRPMTKLRALTMLNECGDTTIVWTSDRDEEMEAIIERKMASGCAFYIIDPRFGTREKLRDARDASRHRMLAIPDEDLLKFVGGTAEPPALRLDEPRLKSLPPAVDVEIEEVPTARAVPTPSTPAKTRRRAKSAREVAENESIGVAPRRGG